MKKKTNFLKGLKKKIIKQKEKDQTKKPGNKNKNNSIQNNNNNQYNSNNNNNNNNPYSNSRDAHRQSSKKRISTYAPYFDKRGPVCRDDLLLPIQSIREVKDADEKRKIFIKKLRLCSYTFDFNKESKDKKENEAREMKRRMLVELIDHLSSSKIWVSEESLKGILHMISCNLFRPLPPSLYDDFDPDEDEPTHDPAWVHLQFVYEFLLRFIVSNNTDAKMLKKFIDRKFLLSIIDLFNSEDPRERDYLKTILHRIYGKFMSFRSFLRRAINNVFYNVIYVTQKHNGLAELLEILGSIINGFATPLKDEHQRFLRNVLIPLHKVKTLSQFHAQLAYCVVQFIEKDPKLSSLIIGGLLKFWPTTSCSKELLYLSELEEVLEMTEQQNFEKFIYPVFQKIADCICSPHFQVAERALFLWNNDVIAAFMSDHRPQILPLLYPALHKNIELHWNPTVTQLTKHIMQQFADMDVELFETVKKRHDRMLQQNNTLIIRVKKWEAVNQLKQINLNKMNNSSNKPIHIKYNGTNITNNNNSNNNNNNGAVPYKNGTDNSVIKSSLNIQ